MEIVHLPQIRGHPAHLIRMSAIILLLAVAALAVVPLGIAHAQTQNQLTVTSQDLSSNNIPGYYTVLFSGGNTVVTGFTPATFILNSGQSYVVQVDDYGSCHFDHWADTGSTTASRPISISANLQITAVYSCGTTSPPPPPPPPPGGGGSGTITIRDHRVYATYWAPCFAATCTNPAAPCNTSCTGPGVGMWIVLYDASGNVVGSGFADENGKTFTGLSPGATYYLNPGDCKLCHGSNHDVLFDHWGTGGNTRPLPVTATGTSVDAWYICTNGCGGY